MRFISTHTHGILDYSVSLAVMMLPWLFNFAAGGPETWIFVTSGAASLLYSLVTRYELGLLRWIPFKGHLALDYLSGIFLAASPWLFGFAGRMYWPHVLCGLLELAVATMSRTTPGLDVQERRWAAGHAL